MSYRSSPAFARKQPGFAPMLEAGRCRVCGCTDDEACIFDQDQDHERACAWADAGHTLCDNPACLASARAASAEAGL